jgi:putative Holliday junction resolvase
MTSQNEPKISQYLAIDYGTARVGLAVGDSEIGIAFTLTTLDNDNQLLENLRQIIAEQEITHIIFGKLGVTGKQTTAFDAEAVGKKMATELGVPVIFQEEMFSTKMAEAALKEKGTRNIKELDNQEAARIILQSFLDKNRWSYRQTRVS